MTAASQPAPAKRAKPRFVTMGQVAALVSVLGFGALCFIGGAATMHAGGFLSKPLSEGFQGAGGFLRGPAGDDPVPEGVREPRVSSKQPAKAADGFTLYTSTQASEALLYDQAGKVVHRWTMPAVEFPGKQKDDPGHWERAVLRPDGRLAALCCPRTDSAYGFGVVMLDRDSKLLWKAAGQFHHDLEVDEDGRVHLFEQAAPSGGMPPLPGLHPSWQDERLVILSKDGQREADISLLEAFAGTPYEPVLLSSDASMPMMPPGAMPPGMGGPGAARAGMAALMARATSPGDVLHPNSARVLTRAMAGKFPLFKAGQVLVSFRSPSLLAVVDVPTKKVVWAARGPWRLQHDAQFLPNGRLLLFDNLGPPTGSRVLEYDPATQAVPWLLAGDEGEGMPTLFRGRCQRLPNGNTRAIFPTRHVVEVGPDKEEVWRLAFSEEDQHRARNILTATFHPVGELTFLKGGADGSR